MCVFDVSIVLNTVFYSRKYTVAFCAGLLISLWHFVRLSIFCVAFCLGGIWSVAFCAVAFCPVALCPYTWLRKQFTTDLVEKLKSERVDNLSSRVGCRIGNWVTTANGWINTHRPTQINSTVESRRRQRCVCIGLYILHFTLCREDFNTCRV